MKKKVVVTGGCGYIGSHTLVDLIENGFDVVSIDNNSRSDPSILKGVEKITGQVVKNYAIDLCNKKDLYETLASLGSIEGIIHFAAYKTVPESVTFPLRYYHNNIASLVNLLSACQEFSIPHFIFSSSCSVYGNVSELPVKEDTVLAPAESPYGNSKKIGEEIIEDFSKSYIDTKCIALRYFNPVGAHMSGIIGENPLGKPENLMPIIIEVATGKREALSVFGSDYDTRDGTCIRDYIHVSDIANAHTKAIEYLIKNSSAPAYDVINLGTGKGVSVLEMINAFESATGIKLKYELAPRRAGDVVAVYADNEKSKRVLGWEAKYNQIDMNASAWNFEQNK